MNKVNARFIKNINSYIVLTAAITVLGAAGLLISFYAYMQNLPKLIIVQYASFAIVCTMFGLFCLKMLGLIKKATKADQEAMLLSAKERKWIRDSLGKIRILAIGMVLFGAGGALLAVYGLVYLQKSNIGRLVEAVSIFYFICYIVIGWVGRRGVIVLHSLNLDRREDAESNG